MLDWILLFFVNGSYVAVHDFKHSADCMRAINRYEKKEQENFICLYTGYQNEKIVNTWKRELKK